MAAFNKVILIGNIGNDLELKKTPNDVSVTSFSLAVKRRYTGKDQEEQTDWINIVAWRNTADFICKYFGKGKPILIVGSLQTRSFTDKDGNKRYVTEVVAEEAQFVSNKSDSEPKQSYSDNANYQNSPYSVNSVGGAVEFEEQTESDDLPF